jgi:uncharacterized YceG family protein
VGEPPVLTPTRPPRRRRPPSRGAIAARLALLLLLVAALGGLAWYYGASELGGGDDDRQPTQPRKRTPGGARRNARTQVLRIVFPEGFTRRQMAERIAAVNEIAREKRHVTPRLSPQRYLGLTTRSSFPRSFPGAGRTRSLEGFLFPALYEFTPRTTTRELVDKQLEAFRESWATVDLRYARSKNLTAYDVLIIASLIEEEVAAPAERRLVSAVIYNRLRRRMRLEIDATIRYALGVPPTQALTLADLRHRTPYNTRIHSRLPPTPITNPGLAAITAAAHPARVKYLFFVRNRDCRTHFFTASFAVFRARLQKPRC